MEKANGVEVIHHVLVRSGLARQVREKARDSWSGGGKGGEAETMAKLKICFPLKTQVLEGTRSLGASLNILEKILK